MPSEDYQFLSDRQREYLENPDEFDSQRAAELSYRIRQKFAAAKDDLELLERTVGTWDKLHWEDSVRIYCSFHRGQAGPDSFGGCSNEIVVDEWRGQGEVSGLPVTQTPSGWVRVNMKSGGSDSTGQAAFETGGVCPDCREKAREYAKDRGTVPCSHTRHTAHRPGSEPFRECMMRLALSDDDIRELDSLASPHRLLDGSGRIEPV